MTMDTTLFTLDDLLKRLSAFIADAVTALDLTALNSADQEEFLRGVTGRTINTFWKTYVEALPATVQSTLRVAMDHDDRDALSGWYMQYANFMEDEHARALATGIIDSMEKALPKQIKNDLAAFLSIVDQS